MRRCFCYGMECLENCEFVEFGGIYFVNVWMCGYYFV